MGRKNVIFCDLCKQEADEDSLSTLTFKKPGKKTGNKYEICSGCAEKLQVQLVGENELSSGWGFGATEMPAGKTPAPSQPTEETAAERRSRLEREASEDDDFVAAKQREVKARNTETPGPETTPGKSETGKCLHYNRTPPVKGTVGGVDQFVQKCRDCREILPLRTADERHAVGKTGD